MALLLVQYRFDTNEAFQCDYARLSETHLTIR